ncbi:MAG: hypothetical protein AAGH15_06150 [Myxococcota bacterium]
MGAEHDPSLYPPGERVVGWYRHDDFARLARAVLPLALVTSLGCVLVGYAHGRLATLDPLLLHAGEGPVATEARRPRPPTLAERRAQLRHVVPAPRGADGPGEALTWVLFALGLGLVAAGPLMMLWRLRGFLRKEDFLLLRTDGLVHQADALRLSLRWDDLERVRYDGDRDAIALVLREPRPAPGTDVPVDAILLRERYAGTSKERLAAQLEELRRKAIWGLLPQQR